jgi:hypothetical protein
MPIQAAVELRRPSEILRSRVDPSKARVELGRQARFTMPDVIDDGGEGVAVSRELRPTNRSPLCCLNKWK